VAWVALHFMAPLRARRAVNAAARFVAKPFPSEREARAGARALGSSGTCLSWSLAVAALLPGSDVVIGVTAHRGAPLRAHAWVELRGGSLDPNGREGDLRPMAILGGLRDI
jgi:hypothetical protein